MTNRDISHCHHKFVLSACRKCAVRQFPSDPAVKTTKYESFLNCGPDKYLRHLRRRQCLTLQAKSITEATNSLLQAICEKFEYGIETLALGLYVFMKACERQEKDQKFWASASLIVASKGIELDKHVPYLNRYQRYADKSFTQEDYELAEKTIFEEMGFDIQYSTFISFINFYLTQGVFFKSDQMPEPAVKLAEDEILERGKEFLKNGEFVAYSPQKLALSIIKEIRIKYRLEPWKEQLRTMSNYEDSQIQVLSTSNNILKPISFFNGTLKNNKEKQREVTSQNQTASSLHNSIQILENKTKLMRRKGDSKAQNVKQNVMKGGLVSNRTIAFSSSKNHQMSLYSSSDRIVPLSNIINRRA